MTWTAAAARLRPSGRVAAEAQGGNQSLARAPPGLHGPSRPLEGDVRGRGPFPLPVPQAVNCAAQRDPGLRSKASVGRAVRLAESVRYLNFMSSASAAQATHRDAVAVLNKAERLEALNRRVTRLTYTCNLHVYTCT